LFVKYYSSRLYVTVEASRECDSVREQADVLEAD